MNSFCKTHENTDICEFLTKSFRYHCVIYFREQLDKYNDIQKAKDQTIKDLPCCKKILRH